MPAFLVTVTDTDPDAAEVDEDMIRAIVDAGVANRGNPGRVKTIEVPRVELAGATAACNAVSESAPFDKVGPLVEFARKTGMALEDTKAEMT